LSVLCFSGERAKKIPAACATAALCNNPIQRSSAPLAAGKVQTEGTLPEERPAATAQGAAERFGLPE
jgi:hypothetical protein